MKIPYTVGMNVKIKDIDDAGIWRNIEGQITRIKGPNIYVNTYMGIVGPFTSAELEPHLQLQLV